MWSGAQSLGAGCRRALASILTPFPAMGFYPQMPRLLEGTVAGLVRKKVFTATWSRCSLSRC